MSKTKETKKELSALIEAIKKINDEPEVSLKKTSDKYTNNIPSTNEFVSEKLGAFQEKRKKKKENKEDIFSEMLKLVEQFMGSEKRDDDKSVEPEKKINDTSKLKVKSKLKKHALSALQKSKDSMKEILLRNLSSALYMGDNLCGAESVFSVDSMTITPKEFDYLDMLSLDPDSGCGLLVYEPKNTDRGKKKINRDLYESFGGTQFSMDTNNGKTLFTMDWNTSSQDFTINGLTQQNSTVKVEDFLNDYYNNLEVPEVEDLLNTAVMLTIQGGCGESKQFDANMDGLRRIIDRLMSICGSPSSDELKKQNAIDLLNESDELSDLYFDFNNIEGIDLDDEDARRRRVLKFKDCYNFEIDSDPSHVDDFIYLSKSKNASDAADLALLSIATDASEQSDSSISVFDLLASLIIKLIVNLPKALIMSIFSAKMFLPFVILWKAFKQGVNNAIDNIKDLIKKFYTAIYNTVKELFWIFITEFWNLIKIDLLNFVKSLVTKIIKNKYKKYLLIVKSLISLLNQALQTSIDNCQDLFNAILNTIKQALNSDAPIRIPAPLLMMAGALPGYSADRAYLNIMERVEASGTPTGPLFGEDNDIGKLVKSIIDGHSEEEDTNSYVNIVLTGGVLPGPPLAGGAIIPPATISGVGKKF